jgi:hypothetical protein
VIAENPVKGSDDTRTISVFVAVGFDMWQVWSSIIVELNYGANSHNDSYDTLLAEIYILDYDENGLHPY